MNKSAFILYYTKENRYSFNALIGALESFDTHKYVDVFFLNPKKDDDTIIDNCLLNYQRVVLGFSFFTTQIWDVYKVVLHLRKKYNDLITLVAGGPHPTGEPKSVLDYGFDYVFVGEGEESINEFFIALATCKNGLNVPGVYRKMDCGEIWYEPRENTVDLDKYLPFSEKYRRFGPIEITRGCPYACNFCQTTQIFGCNVRHRSISAIEKSLEILKRNNLKDFRAITPNALAYGSQDGRSINLNAISELLVTIKRILPEGRIFLGSFPSEVRPEHVSEESMRLLCEYVSNDNIILGAQTGSQRLLDHTHRGHTVADVYNAVEICLQHNMQPNVDFMFGLPGENSDDICKSIMVMNDLIEMGARIHAHTFMPLPQTPFAYKGRGKISDEMRQYIKRNVYQGVIYGDWAEQAKLSQKIDKLLKTKRVDIIDT